MKPRKGHPVWKNHPWNFKKQAKKPMKQRESTEDNLLVNVLIQELKDTHGKA